MAHIDVAGDTGFRTAESSTERAKYNIAKAAVAALAHPFTFSKTLYQLGFEPEKWPMKPMNLIPRHRASHLPATYQFFMGVNKHFGWATMYRGATAAFVGGLTGGFITHIVEQHLDSFFMDIGGNVGDLLKEKDENLTNYESFRVHFRQAIRRSISSTIGLAIAHPFAVLMVREIMKVARKDGACHNVISAFLRMSDEEGLSGLFAGLVPSMIANLVCIWTLFGFAFATNRFLIGIEKRTTSQADRESIKNVRKYVPYTIPFIANSFAYAFEVDAVVASVTGQRQ